MVKQNKEVIRDYRLEEFSFDGVSKPIIARSVETFINGEDRPTRIIIEEGYTIDEVKKSLEGLRVDKKAELDKEESSVKKEVKELKKVISKAEKDKEFKQFLDITRSDKFEEYVGKWQKFKQLQEQEAKLKNNKDKAKDLNKLINQFETIVKENK